MTDSVASFSSRVGSVLCQCRVPPPPLERTLPGHHQGCHGMGALYLFAELTLKARAQSSSLLSAAQSTPAAPPCIPSRVCNQLHLPFSFRGSCPVANPSASLPLCSSADLQFSTRFPNAPAQTCWGEARYLHVKQVPRGPVHRRPEGQGHPPIPQCLEFTPLRYPSTQCPHQPPSPHTALLWTLPRPSQRRASHPLPWTVAGLLRAPVRIPSRQPPR